MSTSGYNVFEDRFKDLLHDMDQHIAARISDAARIENEIAPLLKLRKKVHSARAWAHQAWDDREGITG